LAGKVDLYNPAYGHYEEDAYREIRIETYGQDLGQTSWVVTRESREIPRALKLTPSSFVLEIGCGSGRYALQVAETEGCRVLGVDINRAGIRNATRLAAAGNLAGKVRFEYCDASEKHAFGKNRFDAAFANDVLCHVPDRLAILEELFRVLKRGARLLFSDALVIGGPISDQEIATRSSIGNYILVPPGENERMIRQAGFRLLKVIDTTRNAILIAERRFAARNQRKRILSRIEGKANFEGVQEFLACVARLTAERRLLRFVYLAEKRR
jgi:ubiquinone/menaquinone biosynthesis C-methylase UbiE